MTARAPNINRSKIYEEYVQKLAAIPHDERVKSRLDGTDPLTSGTRTDGTSTCVYGSGNGPVK